jgi:hypothetical protein
MQIGSAVGLRLGIPAHPTNYDITGEAAMAAHGGVALKVTVSIGVAIYDLTTTQPSGRFASLERRRREVSR